jgi:hypothetical protein
MAVQEIYVKLCGHLCGLHGYLQVGKYVLVIKVEFLKGAFLFSFHARNARSVLHLPPARRWEDYDSMRIMLRVVSRKLH